MALLDPPSLRLRWTVRGGHTRASSSCMGAQSLLTRNIRAYLKFARRTQADLAAALNVSQGYVSQLLNEKRDWQIDMLDTIAALFCVTVSALFIESESGGERRHCPTRRTNGGRRSTDGHGFE